MKNSKIDHDPSTPRFLMLNYNGQQQLENTGDNSVRQEDLTQMLSQSQSLQQSIKKIDHLIYQDESMQNYQSNIEKIGKKYLTSEKIENIIVQVSENEENIENSI